MKHPYSASSIMVKFLEKRDHAESFLRGGMRARRLTYFKEIENDPARGDPDDGLRTYRTVLGKPAPASNHFTRVAEVSVGDHRVRRIGFDYTVEEDPYVICLSRFVSGGEDPASCLNQLQRKINGAPKMGAEFGPHAVVISDERAFLDMVGQAARDRGYEVLSEAVTYRTEGKGLNGIEPVDAFCKSARFAPHHEFRIALMGGEAVEETLRLEIGDLGDIARIVRTKDLGRLRLHP